MLTDRGRSVKASSGETGTEKNCEKRENFLINMLHIKGLIRIKLIVCHLRRRKINQPGPE